jgi:hypothetical protein
MASPSNPLAVATTQNIGNLITSLQIKPRQNHNLPMDDGMKRKQHRDFCITYVVIMYSHSSNSRIKMIPKGRDNKLFSRTIEISLRDPLLVNCFAVSITLRRVSCDRVQMS